MNNNIVYKSFTIQIKYLHSWYSYIFIFLETGWFKKINRKKIQGSRFLKKQKQKQKKTGSHCCTLLQYIRSWGENMRTSLPEDLLYTTHSTKTWAAHSSATRMTSSVT